MLRIRVIAALFFILTPSMLVSQSSHSDGTFWSWSEDCTTAQRTLGIEVLVDSKAVYRSSIPICQVAERSKVPRKSIVFSFKGGHVWQGEYRTKPTQTVEGNIWLAGVDSDDLLLGVSFSTKERELLNTIHIAYPNRASRFEIDRSVFVRTFPYTRKSN